VRALRFAEHGEPARVLRLEQLESPEPGAGEVRLRMTYRPINPSDLLTVRGLYPIQPKLPGSPGLEGVGVVDAVGSGVSGIPVGARAISLAGQPGTWAEQFVIPAAAALLVPDAVADRTAAQILVNPMTAWAMLTNELSLASGDWLLQTAAGSTLGRLVIQLAKQRCLRTINVVRRRARRQELLDIGADAVIVTEDESLVDRVRSITKGRGVVGAIDSVAGPETAQVARCLAMNGTMLTMGVLSGNPVATIDTADLLFKGATIRGFWLTNWFQRQTPEMVERAMSEVLTLLATHRLEPVVEAEYELADFAAAIAHSERPGRKGKVLLRG